jgi:hypothetical protein
MEQRLNFTFADKGLWISGVSPEVGETIQAAVLAFRKHHQIPDSSWRVRVYGLANGNQMDVWIGRDRRRPMYGHPYTFFHSIEAGAKVRSLLEELLNLSPHRLKIPLFASGT